MPLTLAFVLLKSPSTGISPASLRRHIIVLLLAVIYTPLLETDVRYPVKAKRTSRRYNGLKLSTTPVMETSAV